MSNPYPFKTEPRPHQVKALKKLIPNGGGGLFAPMRSGKTKTAIDWACAMHLKHGVRRVLFFTHTPTTFGVIKMEVRKHCPLPYRVFIRDELVEEQPNAVIDFMILNIQLVYDRVRVGKRGWEPGDAMWLYEWDPQVLIVDESTTIGDPTSVQSRKIYKLQKDLHVQYKLIMSGTPLHRKLFMAFGQFKFLDDTIFGTSWTSFKETYGLWGGFQKQTLLKYRNVKRFRRKIAPSVFQVRHIPAVPAIHQVRPVILEPKAREMYRRMQLDRVLETDKGQVVAELIVVQLLKLAQMASGFVRTEDGEWVRVSTAKREAYGDLLKDYREAGKQKIIVFSRFLPTLRDIALESKKHGYNVLLLHGGVKSLDREKRYVKFQEAEGRWVFISQISTGSMGIDLSAADTTVYYSLTESLLHYDQSMARARKYKETRTLNYDYLIAEKTIDEVMYLALKNKADLVDFVMKHPDLIHWQEEG